LPCPCPAPPAELQALAVEQASLAHMKANSSKYKEAQPERNKALGRPPEAGATNSEH